MLGCKFALAKNATILHLNIHDTEDLKTRLKEKCVDGK